MYVLKIWVISFTRLLYTFIYIKFIGNNQFNFDSGAPATFQTQEEHILISTLIPSNYKERTSEKLRDLASSGDVGVLASVSFLPLTDLECCGTGMAPYTSVKPSNIMEITNASSTISTKREHAAFESECIHQC
jgi:hypothetical protein